MKKIITTLLLFLSLAIPCFAKAPDMATIQQKIYTGMPQSEVIINLGAPSATTKDPDGYKTWIYRKTTQHSVETYDRHWLFLLVFGKRKGCKSTDTTETTEALIINFDKNDCVSSVRYNANGFQD